jgi:hypothetical protein
MQLSSRPPYSRLVSYLIAACAFASLWAWHTAAFAQDPEILVVSGDKVPDALSEAVSEALGDLGTVQSPSGYTSKARGRSLEPDSEEALTKLAPQTGASLIVVLQQARNKLKVDLRSGRSGEVVGHSSVPARGKKPKLGKPAAKRLLAAAKRALKKAGPPASKAASSASAARDDFEDTPEPQEPVRAATTPKKQPARPTQPVDDDESDQEEDDEQIGGGFAASRDDDDEEEAPPQAAGAAAELKMFHLRAGIGLGSRAILVPTPPGRGFNNKLDTSFVPALDIGAALAFRLGEKWQLRVLVDYRTLIGLRAGLTSSAGMTTVSSLSSHSIIAGLRPGYMSDGPGSFGVHVLLGWAYRGLSAAEPNVPSASIQGVVLRPEIEIPISAIKLSLRLAPELILVFVPNATLPANDNGLKNALGYAIGGELSVDLHISQTVGLSAQFRESRGATPSAFGMDAVENERYFALRLLLQF